MANRRMFAKTIIDSDMFLDMPSTTQNLYFHLNMRADDEGFVNAPKKVMRVIQANTNDLDILIAKKFVLVFESGVLVIKHWKLHNTIRKDRFTKTLYTEEKRLLFEKENGSYTFTRYENAMKQVSSVDIQQLEEPATNWQPDDNQVTTNGLHSIGKVSIDLNLDSNLEESYKEKNTKKENIPYSPYSNIEEPKDSLSKMIMDSINYWNKDSKNYDGFVSCRWKVISSVPIAGELRTVLDNYGIDEVTRAIDNLKFCWKGIDAPFRISSYENFMTKSLGKWIDEAKPRDKFEIKRTYRTPEERRYFTDAIRIGKDDPKWLEGKKQECIKSLEDIGEEFIDYE